MSKIGVIIIIIAIILGLALIIVGTIIISQKGSGSKNVDPNTLLSVYLKAKDSETKESINANYFIFIKKDEELTRFLKGNLDKDSWTEIEEVPKDNVLDIYVWNDEYYMENEFKNFTQLEKLNNASKIELELEKMGGLEITKTGVLSGTLSTISINLTAIDGSYKKIGFVVSWTPGILDVNLAKQGIQCNKGLWINYSGYDIMTQKYTYLPEHTYKCGDYEEMCDSIVGINCYAMEKPMPLRFQGIVDKFFYLGQELKDGETYTFAINVKALDNANVLDDVTLTFFDYEKIWNEALQEWVIVPDFQNEDVGAGDYQYQINYQTQF